MEAILIAFLYEKQECEYSTVHEISIYFYIIYVKMF